MKLFVCLFSFLLLTSSTLLAQDPVAIMAKMKAAIRNMNQSTFDLVSKERFGSEYVTKRLHFRVQESPRSVYMKDKETGVEMLYVPGWNNNKAYINPNGFPWVNVSLGIYDSRVVSENHHTVKDAGLGFVNVLLSGFESTVKKAGISIDKLYTYKGEVMFNGRPCHRIYMIPPSGFKYISYTTDRDQNLVQLSRRIVASDYLIKERNNRISYNRTIKKGTTLSVPSAYASKVIVYIDKETYMPVVQMLYDERGLFEKYEYTNINRRPNFGSDEFTTNCSKYGF
jgi:outer membrane lipoprotein-sorting protein